MQTTIIQLYKGIVFGVGTMVVLLFGAYITKAWNYTDPQPVTTNDTLTATGWNAMVESLFWKRDGENNISFIAGNASVNAPTIDSHIATKKYVDDKIPSGAVMAFNLSACPSGWSDFAHAQGRVIVGVGSTTDTPTGGQSRSGVSKSFSLLQKAGEFVHTLSHAETPSHRIASIAGGVPTGYNKTAMFDPIANGGDEPHNNIQPYVALRYCIKD